jgi:hypothetical protein
LSLRLSPSDIASVQAPVARFGRSPDGQSIDIVDEPKMRQLAKALRGRHDGRYVRSYPSEARPVGDDIDRAADGREERGCEASRDRIGTDQLRASFRANDSEIRGGEVSTPP